MKLDLLPEALDELAESIAYYEAQVPGLGARFFNAIADTIELAAENSRLGAAMLPPAEAVRKFVVPRFPFVVIVSEVDGVTKVIGVTHARRRPGHWLDRLDP
ncbi:MAG: type II toxin-antitoxin system RelE/ParE family toxin [Polyangiales bacterium]|nr:type II toxin-antitoxin system RelE/ParE family toxin [Myxococcales bacterium]